MRIPAMKSSLIEEDKVRIFNTSIFLDKKGYEKLKKMLDSLVQLTQEEKIFSIISNHTGRGMEEWGALSGVNWRESLGFFTVALITYQILNKIYVYFYERTITPNKEELAEKLIKLSNSIYRKSIDLLEERNDEVTVLVNAISAGYLRNVAFLVENGEEIDNFRITLITPKAGSEVGEDKLRVHLTLLGLTYFPSDDTFGLGVSYVESEGNLDLHMFLS